MSSQPRKLNRVPGATYRLQFNRDFTFVQAAALADYLIELGITDCYASPIFKATPQSMHGYDVCGFDELNPNLGTAQDFERFSTRLQELNLGLLLDMVPNHMGAHLSNRWWADVLEKGESSPHARTFDIDWRQGASALEGKVLVPTLEGHYSEVLEAGRLKLVFEQGKFLIAYHERRFPLSPESVPEIFEGAESLEGSRETKVGENPVTSFEIVWSKNLLTAALDHLNGKPGVEQSFNSLHALLQRQHYRLAYWRAAAEQINYRRFFDVTELVSVRVELPEVFSAVHGLVFRLLQQGIVTGLRIDHPDGLWNPRQYFERIQEQAPRPGFPPGLQTEDRLFVVAEKILSGAEPLPPGWPVEGTTGYDFLNQLNGLFVNGASCAQLDRAYHDFTGSELDLETSIYLGKKHMLEHSLISEVKALTRRLQSLAVSTRYGQDFGSDQLRSALVEIIAAFSVYRTYADEETRELPLHEAEYVAQAAHHASQRAPGIDPAILAFIRELLLLRPPEDFDDAGRHAAREFVMRFQQLTGPAMAKGLEDTAFYNFNRLISLNEVGGDPGTFGVTVEQFHQYNRSKLEAWPHSLLATATHDTKRGEDTRARINVLSELPEEWSEAVKRWSALNAGHKTGVNGQPAPHPNDEYLLYQTLIGSWPNNNAQQSSTNPPYRERITAYMLKALREAKTRTSWTTPESDYEAAIAAFVERILATSESNTFLSDFRRFQRKLACFGQFNSLSQVLLKATSPGVPDFYQGAELWDLSLVDPDNRQPVDYELRRRLLAELNQTPPETPDFLPRLLAESQTGQIKLYVTWRALQFRSEHPDLFARGSYLPVSARGSKSEHLCAFARMCEKQCALVVAPRLIAGLLKNEERPPIGAAIWENTCLELPAALSGATFQNIFTLENVQVQATHEGFSLLASEALATFPVALLWR